MAENVAHPGVPPAEETTKFVVEAVEETERLLDVAFVTFAFVANRFVEVAFVDVEVSVERLKMVEEAFTRIPIVVVGRSDPATTDQSPNCVFQ